MKQLTDEKIVEIARATKTAEPGRDGFILPCAFARAIEAEVLRLNGWQPIEKAPMDGAEVLVGEEGSGDYELARYHVGMGWLDRCSDDLHFTPTHFLDPMPPEAPRASGCPDTMDETAEIAVALKQAGEEKSPPATGPAG